MPGSGPTWITGYAALPDKNGKLKTTNLHSYWDGGIGSFPPTGPNFRPPPLSQIPAAAALATSGNPDTDPELKLDDPFNFNGWAEESFELVPEIDRRFLNSPDETKTQPEKEFAVGFAKQIGDMGALVTRILAAVFFTILILTGNAMAQSVRERIPELAILKTLGFSDGKVTALVLAEAGLLLLLGGGLGMVIAAALLPVLNGATGGRFPPLFVSADTWLLATAVAVTLALAVGLPRSTRSSRSRW